MDIKAEKLSAMKKILQPLLRGINLGYNRLKISNHFKIDKRNKMNFGLTSLKKCRITINGNNNIVILEDGCKLNNSQININGNSNTIRIGKNVFMNDVELYIEDAENQITIGANTALCGTAQLAAIEGTKITIGERCMFSSYIHFRTGDSHSILDHEGKRINPSKDITIGNHVWIGTKVTCLKGVTVGDDCIVGATATLTGTYNMRNCIIAGVPAKVVKDNVNWCAQRIKPGTYLPKE